MVHWKGQHGVYTAWVVCRDIVKASHLTCLDHDDITGRKERKQPWNPAVSSSCGEEIPDCHGNTDPAPPASADAKPVTVQKFMREWKNLKGSPQEQYLWVLVPVSMVPNILGGGMWADISCSVHQPDEGSNSQLGDQIISRVATLSTVAKLHSQIEIRDLVNSPCKKSGCGW